MGQIEKGIVIEIEAGARFKNNANGSGHQDRDPHSTQDPWTTFGNMKFGVGLAARYGSGPVQCQKQKTSRQQVERAWNGMSTKGSLCTKLC